MPKISHADRKAWLEALIADHPGMEPSMAENILWTYEHKADWMIAEMKRKQRLAKLKERKDAGQAAAPQTSDATA